MKTKTSKGEGVTLDLDNVTHAMILAAVQVTGRSREQVVHDALLLLIRELFRAPEFPPEA